MIQHKKGDPYMVHFRCTRCNAVIYANFKKMVRILDGEGYRVEKKEEEVKTTTKGT